MSRLAVLIPVFNDPVGLAYTLGSLKLEFEKHDIVLVDDGSQPPVERPPGCKMIRMETNKGIAGALNGGLEWILDNGYEFVGRIDAADKYCPGRFALQTRLLEENPDVVMVGGQAVFVGSEGQVAFPWRVPIHDAALRRRQRIRNCFIHPTLMYRVQALREVGVYREDVPGAEDYELALRLMAVGRVANLAETLVQTRFRGSGISGAQRRQQMRSMLAIQLSSFDWAMPESYLGLLWSGLRFVTPYAATSRLKGWVR